MKQWSWDDADLLSIAHFNMTDQAFDEFMEQVNWDDVAAQFDAEMKAMVHETSARLTSSDAEEPEEPNLGVD